MDPSGRAPAPEQPSGPQPMRASMVIEVSLRVLRRGWATALVLALLFAGPGALLTAAMSIRFSGVALDIFPSISEGLLDDTAMLTAAQLERLVGALAGYLVATIVAGLLGSVGAVAFGAMVLADYRGQPAALGPALTTGLRRTPSVVAFVLVTTGIVVGMAIAAGAAIMLSLTLLSSGAIDRGGPGVFVALVVLVSLVVGIAYLTVRWALAFPLMAVEDAGWRAALSRSWYLSGDNVWRVVLIVVLGGLATNLGAALVAQLLSIVFVDLLAAPAGLDTTIAESFAIAVGSMLLAPLAPVLLAVLCLDLKVRRDGRTEVLREGPSATEGQ